MVYRNISQDVKERALWLIAHNYAPEDICELFDISPSSLKRWRRNDRIHGSVKPPTNPNRGRPRILNSNMTHDLYTLISKAPDIYLDEIQDWIALAYEVGISKCSLFRNIRDAGVTYKLLWKAAAERDEDARQEWKDEVNDISQRADGLCYGRHPWTTFWRKNNGDEKFKDCFGGICCTGLCRNSVLDSAQVGYSCLVGRRSIDGTSDHWR